MFSLVIYLLSFLPLYEASRSSSLDRCDLRTFSPTLRSRRFLLIFQRTSPAPGGASQERDTTYQSARHWASIAIFERESSTPRKAESRPKVRPGSELCGARLVRKVPDPGRPTASFSKNIETASKRPQERAPQVSLLFAIDAIQPYQRGLYQTYLTFASTSSTCSKSSSGVPLLVRIKSDSFSAPKMFCLVGSLGFDSRRSWSSHCS